MSRRFAPLAALAFLAVLWAAPASAQTCTGRFVNPISDACWECLFPISIGPIAPDVLSALVPDGFMGEGQFAVNLCVVGVDHGAGVDMILHEAVQRPSARIGKFELSKDLAAAAFHVGSIRPRKESPGPH